MPSDKDKPEEDKASGEDNQLPDNLPDDLSDIVSDLPEERQQDFLIRIARFFSARFFSGPIPPPEELEKYKKIQPDFPERIMGMAEKEQDARIAGVERRDSIENRKVNGAIFLGFTVLAVAAIATIMGATKIAISLGTIGIIGSVFRAFLQKKSSN